MLTDETVNGEKYKVGINKREKPFEFYDMDLFISLNKPTMWLRQVDIPKGVKITEEYLDDYNDMYTRYSANEIILGSKKSLTLKNLNFLINMSVDISVGDYNILHWAIVNNHPKIFKELIKHIDPRENIMSRLYSTASKYKKQSIINILNSKVTKIAEIKHVCDHCKYPILKDGFHIIINEIDDINSDLNSGCYYHQACVIPAVELNVIKNYCGETKG
jgi:hypothetical protein